jgi:cell division protein DivIC
VKQGLKRMKKPNIVQLNNQFINDENLKKHYEEEEVRKRNRFIGWILVVTMLLFILPTYNLVRSYVTLQERKEQVVSLQKDYDELVAETDAEKLLAKRLQDNTYVEKYARAKYYLSRSGETIFPLPNLIPK